MFIINWAIVREIMVVGGGSIDWDGGGVCAESVVDIGVDVTFVVMGIVVVEVVIIDGIIYITVLWRLVMIASTRIGDNIQILCTTLERIGNRSFSTQTD